MLVTSCFLIVCFQHGDFGNDLAALSHVSPHESRSTNQERDFEEEPIDSNLNGLLSKIIVEFHEVNLNHATSLV